MGAPFKDTNLHVKSEQSQWNEKESERKKAKLRLYDAFDSSRKDSKSEREKDCGAND
jgi:hypothetical protein